VWEEIMVGSFRALHGQEKKVEFSRCTMPEDTALCFLFIWRSDYFHPQ
jgi:hypothetical protein